MAYHRHGSMIPPKGVIAPKPTLEAVSSGFPSQSPPLLPKEKNSEKVQKIPPVSCRSKSLQNRSQCAMALQGKKTMVIGDSVAPPFLCPVATASRRGLFTPRESGDSNFIQEIQWWEKILFKGSRAKSFRKFSEEKKKPF